MYKQRLTKLKQQFASLGQDRAHKIEQGAAGCALLVRHDEITA
jgi:hypothetical protein